MIANILFNRCTINLIRKVNQASSLILNENKHPQARRESMDFSGGKLLLYPADLVSVDYKINKRGKLKSFENEITI